MDLSERRSALVAAAAAIAETLAAQAPVDEANGTLSPETVSALEGAGFFGLKLPAALGGAEADPVAQLLVFEELAKSNVSASWCAMVGATGSDISPPRKKIKIPVHPERPSAPRRNGAPPGPDVRCR